MTDLEATKLCAAAMGLKCFVDAYGDFCIDAGASADDDPIYWPLHDDAQCMALIKRFSLEITHDDIETWVCSGQADEWRTASKDLNAAVVYCVAKMKLEAKEPLAQEQT